MKLLHFLKENEPSLGVKTEQGILDVKKASELFGQSIPTTLHELLHQGEVGKKQLLDLVAQAHRAPATEGLYVQEEDIQFAPAVTQPEKIICTGFNYINHVKETKTKIPESPVLFSKFNNALAAHNEDILIPEVTQQMDYEAELVIVIGKTGKNISKEEALSYVFGYTMGNDLSARDLQFKTGQFLLGKTADGFAPVGPYITTKDEIGDPQNLRVECRVNGDLRQNGHTSHMIFECATLISYISETMTLKPGDIIFTGTPDGVVLGYPNEKQVWLKSGDEIIVAIEGLGELRNTLK